MQSTLLEFWPKGEQLESDSFRKDSYRFRQETEVPAFECTRVGALLPSQRTIVLAGNELITSSPVELLKEGRQVAAAVHKTIVSTRQPAAQAKAARKQQSRKSRPWPAIFLVRE
jgi:hypothetical protein